MSKNNKLFKLVLTVGVAVLVLGMVIFYMVEGM